MKIEGKLLLEPKQFRPSFDGWVVKGVINPGASRLPDGRILIYVRVAETAGQAHEQMVSCPVITSESYDTVHHKINKKEIVNRGNSKEVYMKDGSCRLPTISHFRRVYLNRNGWDIEHIEQIPAFTGTSSEGQYGVEDPRITKIGNKYYMTYVVVSEKEGVSTALASSKDMISWTRMGIIFRLQNKDAVLFPEKINNCYVALHRPEGFFAFTKPSIWISHSPDLIYWGREKALIQPRIKSWGGDRVGAGCPPIRTKKGWLVIYHGMRGDGDSRVYSAGAFLLDLKNPEIVLARSSPREPLFGPSYDFEKKGFIGNVVFPTAAVPTLDNESLLIYSGGADSVTSVRTIRIQHIMQNMEYYK